MSRSLGAKELDALLADAPTYESVGTVRAAQVTADSKWTTARGDRLDAHVGDWWVTDGDEHWSVATDVFAATYECVGGEHFRKKATVIAVQLHEPFAIETLEGRSTGDAGDWLVRNPSGECWPIPAEVFAKRYRLASL